MQKTIVRRGLIAVLFALIMVLCCMPQKANADTIIKLDDTGTLSGYTYTVPMTFKGEWYEMLSSGEATFTRVEGKNIKVYVYYGDDDSIEVSGDVIDFEAILKDIAEEHPEFDGNTVEVTVSAYVSDGEGHEGEAQIEYMSFVTIDAQAVVQDKVTEDTTFEYEVDALVERYHVDEEYKEIYDAYRADAKGAQLVDNTLTIKKGNSVSEALDCLVLVVRHAYNEWSDGEYDDYYHYSEQAYFIVEKDNKYGYARSNNVYGVMDIDYFDETDLAEAFSKNDFYAIVGFDNVENGADGFVTTWNAADAEFNKTQDWDERSNNIRFILNKLVPLNGAEKTISATFNHGVNTADNSDLGLWIALLAIAMVCGGAVALKRN